MDWKRQVRTVGCFHPHHAQKKLITHQKGWPGIFRRRTLPSWDSIAISSVPWTELHVQLPNRHHRAPRGEGKWASPPAILCSCSHGRRYRGRPLRAAGLHPVQTQPVGLYHPVSILRGCTVPHAASGGVDTAGTSKQPLFCFDILC